MGALGAVICPRSSNSDARGPFEAEMEAKLRTCIHASVTHLCRTRAHAGEAASGGSDRDDAPVPPRPLQAAVAHVRAHLAARALRACSAPPQQLWPHAVCLVMSPHACLRAAAAEFFDAHVGPLVVAAAARSGGGGGSAGCVEPQAPKAM